MLPRLGDALRLDNVRANPWLALSIIEGEHDARGLDWATAWLRVTLRRMFSFAEHAWRDVSGSSPAR